MSNKFERANRKIKNGFKRRNKIKTLQTPINVLLGTRTKNGKRQPSPLILVGYFVIVLFFYFEKGILLQNKSPKVHSEENEGVSACLTIKDDNFRLIEWLAYNYHVLPLRHLIVAVDPGSETTPLPILQRWDDTDLTYIVWGDTDFIEGSEIMSRKKRKENALQSNSSDELLKLYDERQLLFLSKCYEHHKLMGHSWVLHVDTDEYVVFNSVSENEPTMDETETKIEVRQDRYFLPKIGEAKILDLLEKKRDLCVTMPRLLFGGVEANDFETKEIKKHSLSFDPKHFETLRFVRHHIMGNFEIPGSHDAVNGNGKVFLDVSRIPLEKFEPNDMFSIHRPFLKICQSNGSNPRSFVSSTLRVNHYIGSREAYNSRNDFRRNAENYERKANSNNGTSFDIIPWLEHFTREFGENKAHILLQDAGDIQSTSNGDFAYKKQSKPCALLFFGLVRKLKDVTYPTIKRNILDINPTCDVFVHTYYVKRDKGGDFTLEDGEGIIAVEEAFILTDYSKIMFETEEEFQHQRNLTFFRTIIPEPSPWEHPIGMDNMVRQWHSISQVWNLMEAHEKKLHKRYDRVGLFRSDVYYTHPIQIKDENETAVIPAMMYQPNLWDGLNDEMFYGERAYAEVWATKRFNSVVDYLVWQDEILDASKKFGLHSNNFLLYILTKKWSIPLTIKDICFFRVRSSGKISKNDCDS